MDDYFVTARDETKMTSRGISNGLYNLNPNLL